MHWVQSRQLKSDEWLDEACSIDYADIARYHEAAISRSPELCWRIITLKPEIIMHDEKLKHD